MKTRKAIVTAYWFSRRDTRLARDIKSYHGEAELQEMDYPDNYYPTVKLILPGLSYVIQDAAIFDYTTTPPRLLTTGGMLWGTLQTGVQEAHEYPLPEVFYNGRDIILIERNEHGEPGSYPGIRVLLRGDDQPKQEDKP